MKGSVPRHLFVILGGTGDLAARKLLPALAPLMAGDDRSVVLGVARDTERSDASYRAWARDALEEQAVLDEAVAAWCDDCVFYHGIGDGDTPAYQELQEKIGAIEERFDLPGNRVFYLALPPGAFPSTIERLGSVGLNEAPGWARIVIEKPFGRDLDSARELNRLVHGHFREEQVYRIDHYLGKETVQNLLVFRFANPIFESLWTRDRIESVAITVAEDLGVGTRAGYYDDAGALRDMVQNHLTQLLTLVAMEVPAAFDADAIRAEKVKVLSSVEPLERADAVFGQYEAGTVNGEAVPGYREEEGVAEGSDTETFVALRVRIANWRWQGVPFYLRTGKRLARRVTRIVVNFTRAPVSIFQPFDECEIHANRLVMQLQPDEGFDLHFEVKSPGDGIELVTQKLEFEYEDAFEPLPDAYVTLLRDVVTGDQTLFVRSDEVEAAWRLYAPLLAADREVRPYAAGGWGPDEADALLVEHDAWPNP